jgi:hypothetical protein
VAAGAGETARGVVRASAGKTAGGVVRASAGKTAGGVVAAGTGNATGGVLRSATGDGVGGGVRAGAKKSTGGVVRAGARNSAGSIVRAGARDTRGGVVSVLGEATGNAATRGVRAGESATSGRTVAVAGRCETAVIRVYARVGLVSHVGGVGTCSRVGTIGVRVGRVTCTVGLVHVRVASQAAVGACKSAVGAGQTLRASHAVRASQATVRAGHTVRAGQAGAVRGIAIRTVAVIADWKAAGRGNRATVLETFGRTADETASLDAVVVKSVRVETVVVVVRERAGVGVGVSRVAVGVAVVAWVRVHSRIELIEHVRHVWAHCLVVLHLLGLRLNSRVYNIGGVARVGTQGMRCRAGRAVVMSRAVRARRRAVQGSVGGGGGARVRLTAAEVGVAGRSAQGCSRGAIAGSVAAAHSANVAVVRINSRIGFVGQVRGVRS